ncbi:MAG: Gfo/Idh/MocA family oxidoreductase, partial [Gammaproteobacteria bacterium]|nr:Gfo/Idh/MocA family oxidoreductase [Gammaproteobacteria bacterium]
LTPQRNSTMAKKRSTGKIIRVGVVGLGRGRAFARGAGPQLGIKLVALCDTWEEKLAAVGKELGVATYTDYEKFLAHDMDAVILANYFHQHAPFAIKALQAGKHVMSETTACLTLAEGVALIREVEKSGRIYMFAENYPYMLFNQEMRRIYRSGRIGQFMYGEGEYVHPEDADFWNRISPGVDHWRNWIPATYYSTHALAPIMFITDTRPVKVNGFVVPYAEDDPVPERSVRQNDAASMIALRMDNGAVVKLLQVHLRGESIWVRIHGSRGQMENLRHGDRNMVRLRREHYHEERTEPVEQIYLPDFPEHRAEALKAGHGGGDFFMNFHFAEAIRKNEQPFLDVYRAVAMSTVGILAYRSALQDSNTLQVPDFRRESEREKYAADDWSPDPAKWREDQPWPSILGDIEPTGKGLAYAHKVWKSIGYDGD